MVSSLWRIACMVRVTVGFRAARSVVRRERVSEGRKDFFVSHTGSDRAWAEWVAWQLAEAGYQVELDVWDWAAGQDFITKLGRYGKLPARSISARGSARTSPGLLSAASCS